MKSLLNKRLPGILAVGLLALVVGATGATAGASSSASNDASVSGLTAKQKKAKKKALKKCKKIKNAKKRKACIKKVNKKYRPKPGLPQGKTYEVDVRDDYYSPATLTIKAGDLINWVWDNSNANPHNVTISDGPKSLTETDKYNLTTPNSPATQYSFKRQLTKPGKYNFYCYLHSTVMKMDVTVTK